MDNRLKMTVLLSYNLKLGFSSLIELMLRQQASSRI